MHDTLSTGWRPVDNATDTSPEQFPFMAEPGMKTSLSSDSPLDFFQLFFGYDTMQLLAEETNR